MLGHADAAYHRQAADWDAGGARRLEVDVVRLRPEPLDQPQIVTRSDDIGVNLAAALGDQELLAGQQRDDLVLGWRAAQRHIELGGRCVQRGLLMPLAAVGDEQGGMCGHGWPRLRGAYCVLWQRMVGTVQAYSWPYTKGNNA